MRVIHLPEWAKSNEGRAIELAYTEGFFEAPPNTVRLIVGGVHGDEPEGVALATQLLNWLAPKPSSKSRTKASWGIIPCLNPDGYLKGERTNGRGVDLNRNYPSKNWSPEAEKARYNPGPEPASEPEIKALTQLILKVKPRVVIHCHSWNPCIVLTGPKDLSEAHYLHQASGYEVQDSIGYPTPGSLSQWGWLDHQIPIICIEEAEGTSAADTWKRFQPAFAKIFDVG